MEFETFPNPPIIEALMDIRVTLPKNINADILKMVGEKLKDRYPERKEKRLFQASFKLDSTGPTLETPVEGIDGFLFKSHDKPQIFQSRFDGFTFNRLRPYEIWSAMRSEAQELWDHYAQITSPMKITRIIVKYINRIEIPLPFGDFKNYILTIPEIAPDLPQGMQSFMMRLVISKKKIKANAVISETMEPTVENKLPFIFDIEVFRVFEDEHQPADIWPYFEELRTFKNEIFFNSLTPKAKGLFR